MTATDTSLIHSAPAAALAGTQSQSAARVPPLVLIYIIGLFLPMGFSLGPLAMSPLRLFLLIITPILFVNLFTGRYGRIRATDILFILYLVWVTVALAVNNPEMVVENSGSTSMEFLGGYLVARSSIRSREHFIGFCKAWTLLIALTIIPVLIEQVTSKAVVMMLIDAIPGIKTPGDGYYTRNGLQRVQVVFSHPILYGLVCSTAISLSYLALQGQMANTKRLFRTAIVSTCTFFALSSGAILAMLLHFFMIGWAWAFAQMKQRWLLLLGLAILAYIAIDLLSTRTPMRVFLTYATFSAQTAYTRLYIFEWGMVNVWANPIFGLGFNDWVRPPFMGSSVDNFWLLTAMRYGIPGFLFLAVGYFVLIWKVGRKNFDGDAIMLLLRRSWVFTLVGVCFTLATVHIWSAPFSLFGFLLGAGVWFLDATPKTGSDPEHSDTSPTVSNGPVYTRTRLSNQNASQAKPQNAQKSYPTTRYARTHPPSTRRVGDDDKPD